MNSHSRFSGWLFCALLPLGVSADSARVTLVRTPHGGIQPQAVADARGVTHLIYFKGEARGGDVFYVRQEPGLETFSAPLQVNSRPGSAMAAGTIRGAQLVLGRNGRAHVVWNGPAPAKGEHMLAPMLYTRLNDAGTAFEPERDVITFARGLDGGGSVAADDTGNVYVMWHAPKPGNTEGEAGRAVWLARSTDDGKSFAKEIQANEKPTGACGCCGMKAFADRAGNVFALYRGASGKVNRDGILLMSRDRGASFETVHSHPWNVASCPMSSAAFSESAGGTTAAWETTGQVYFASVDGKTSRISKPAAPPGNGRRKHPVTAFNARGEMLLAWTDGTGWQKGGAVAWQVFGADGKPTAEKGRADGVPVWSLVSVVPRGDEGFVIIY